MALRTRFRKRQYFVAISLFNALELAKIAKIDWRDPNGFGPIYAIKCGPDGEFKQLGWAFVSEHASATTAWNEKMRDKGLTYSTWQDGRVYDWWPEGVVPDPKTLDDVKLCATYEAKTKYEREAANDVWDKIRSGHPAYIEWYDGSVDKRWTKMFRP